MVNAIITSLALFGASVSALGRAHVVNKCSYDVYMCETPADGGGYSTVDKTLQPGDEWDQQYTSLSNSAGWSIKLSKNEGSFGSNILQYEYTYQNDNMIWYDLSCVDGNPWDGNWEITSNTDTCNPKQQAYRYATDDAYGMQSCDSDASITVTLCSGEAGDNSTDSNSAPSYESASSASAASPATYEAPEPSTYAASPTTFATLTTAAAAGYSQGSDGNIVIVTNVVTEYATATAYAKRHQHHPRGAHQQHA